MLSGRKDEPVSHVSVPVCVEVSGRWEQREEGTQGAGKGGRLEHPVEVKGQMRTPESWER